VPFFGVFDEEGREVTPSTIGKQKLYMMIFIQPALAESGRLSNVVESVEVDYDDGQGWVDLTQKAYAGWDSSDINSWEAREYTNPGTYAVQTRVTSKDGEVFANPGPTVVIVAPSP
jgi:hypothetical protein